jgi:hypothetical protein
MSINNRNRKRSARNSTPAVELPEVGDAILIAARPYGHHIISEGYEVTNGTDIIEVEVKSIKKAKLTIE